MPHPSDGALRIPNRTEGDPVVVEFPVNAQQFGALKYELFPGRDIWQPPLGSFSELTQGMTRVFLSLPGLLERMRGSEGDIVRSKLDRSLFVLGVRETFYADTSLTSNRRYRDLSDTLKPEERSSIYLGELIRGFEGEFGELRNAVIPKAETEGRVLWGHSGQRVAFVDLAQWMNRFLETPLDLKTQPVRGEHGDYLYLDPELIALWIKHQIADAGRANMMGII